MYIRKTRIEKGKFMGVRRYFQKLLVVSDCGVIYTRPVF